METLNTLKPYLRPYWKQAVIAPLLMVVEVVCDLLLPHLLQTIVDQGVATHDTALVLHTGILMLIVTGIGAVGGIGCTIFAVRASMNFGAALRSAVYRKVQTLSFGNLDRIGTAELVTRLTNDVNQVQEMLLMALRILVRAPLLVVGHSAGGMTARLLTSPVPFAGRRLNASGRIGSIVSLGTPHVVSGDGDLGNQIGAHAAAFADREVPGPFFAPRIGYLSVASRTLAGRPDGDARARWAWRVYQGLVADPMATEIDGDGLVPVRSALLQGAPSLVLDGAAHGQWPGRDWYGSDRFLDHWWPLAIESWTAALLARAETTFDGSDDRR